MVSVRPKELNSINANKLAVVMPFLTDTIERLAAEFELPVTQVTNHLAWARREFRRIVLDRLREMTGSDEEFREEAKDLLGVGTADKLR